MRSAKNAPSPLFSSVCLCPDAICAQFETKPRSAWATTPTVRIHSSLVGRKSKEGSRAARTSTPPALTKQKNNGGSTHGSLAISLSLTLHGRPPRATRLRFVQNTDNDEAILEPECLPILPLASTLTRARHMLQYDMLRWPSHGLRHSSWPKKRSRLVLDAIVLTDDPTLQTMGLGSGQMYAYHVGSYFVSRYKNTLRSYEQ
jgi:hypothetical protein